MLVQMTLRITDTGDSKMGSERISDVHSSGKANPHQPGIPVEELALDVYETATPEVRSHMLTKLVSKVYDSAPLPERSRILEKLLMPMGVLSLVTVANGIFAKIRFRGGWPQCQVNIEDAQNVRACDVVALVDHVQQISNDAINGLADVISTSPILASSAAASVLMVLLLRYSFKRRSTDEE
jgi:hypothetical protein